MLKEFHILEGKERIVLWCGIRPIGELIPDIFGFKFRSYLDIVQHNLTPRSKSQIISAVQDDLELFKTHLWK